MKRIIYCLFLFIALLISSFAFGGTVKQDPKLITGKLANGLTYYIYPNNYPKGEAVFRLFIKSGSVFENENQRGLAHFVEHMAFNGTKTFPGNALIRYLESKGAKFGQDLNAHTSFNETVYKLQLPTNDPGMVDTTMVSTGDRSAKIRTYNYPQGRVTDHRINFTIYNLSTFMNGDLQEMIDKLIIAENAERLKAAEL